MNLINLGLVPYSEALELQYRLQTARQMDQIDDTILLLEHKPVLTLGTRGKLENIYCDQEELEAAGITIFNVSRGGDVTYHGPGQLIVYPIVKLYNREGGICSFIHSIEQAVIDWLKTEFDIDSYSGQNKLTGVWVGEAKIMAVGLAVNQGVTMHGLALNLLTDLKPFSWINPCGLGKPVTSLELLTAKEINFDRAVREIGELIANQLGDNFAWCGLEDIT